jgi:DnaK suppressor protein
MRQPELDSFKRVITQMIDAAEEPLRKRDEIAVESAPDEVDRVQNAAARELAIRRLESDALRLQSLRSALDRIRDGTYGTCLLCDEPINEKRLAAIPWAAYCLSCQEMLDEQERETRKQEALQHI